jgi:hypothetical protein
MNRIILLLAVVISSQLSTQEKASEPTKETARVLEDKFTVSLGLRSSEPATFGVTIEWKDAKKSFGFNKSSLYEISLGAISVSNGFETVTGSGFVITSGTKRFFKKESWKGFYSQNGAEFGYIRFSDVNYTGTYKYISFFNPDLGFKWKVSKGFSIDPSVGCMWKIEWKGTGDVDNKIFTNFVPKIGLKIGYSF